MFDFLCTLATIYLLPVGIFSIQLVPGLRTTFLPTLSRLIEKQVDLQVQVFGDAPFLFLFFSFVFDSHLEDGSRWFLAHLRHCIVQSLYLYIYICVSEKYVRSWTLFLSSLLSA